MTIQKEVADLIIDNTQELEKFADHAIHARDMSILLDKIAEFIDTIEEMHDNWIDNINVIKKGYEFMLGKEQYLQNRRR